MDLKEIVSIGGIGGLHKIIGQRSTGLIVETLDSTKKRFPTTLSQKVSILEDIAMYTNDGESKLRDVMINVKNLENDGLTVPDKKADDATLRAFMDKALPEYDKERVYVSDIRKLAQWYHMLKPVLDWDAMTKGEEVVEEKAAEKEGKETKEAKKPAAKKTTAKTAAAPKMKAMKSANVKTQNNTPRKTGGA